MKYKFKLGKIVSQVLFGANIATAVGMYITGYSYLIDPASFSLASTWGLFFPFFFAICILFMFFWLLVDAGKFFIAFFLLLGCFFPARMYFGINPLKSIEPGTIKVMSYNAFGFHGMKDKPLDRDSNAIAYYLIESDCDIICLQEALPNGLSDNMKAKLAKVYPYHSENEKNHNTISIYSKYKILSSDSIPYESAGNLSAAYTLQTKHGKIIVINNHFETNSLSLEEQKQFRSMITGGMDRDSIREESKNLLTKLAEASLIRNKQVKAVAEFIRQHEGENIILCGDFNENPVSYNRHMLDELLTDCFINSGVGTGWSFCHHGMRVRIDNIMCSERFTPTCTEVDNKVDYSDHYPIVTWLKFEAENQEN